MNWTIIIVIMVLLLMILALFFLLKREVVDIHNKSRVYFSRKAQEYMENIQTKDEEKTASSQEQESTSSSDSDEHPLTSVVYVEKRANYEIQDLLKMMREVDEKFSVNNVDVIQKFMDHNVHEDMDKIERYQKLKQMQDYIHKIGIYNIIVNDDMDNILRIIQELRLIDEDIFMEFYSGKDEFDVEDFCNFLDYEIGKCDPTVYIYVGNRQLNYNQLDRRIKTVYSDDIYKGVKIVYLNKMYDYSLSS